MQSAVVFDLCIYIYIYCLFSFFFVFRYFDFHIGGDSLDVSGDWAMLNAVKDYLASVGSRVYS